MVTIFINRNTLCNLLLNQEESRLIMELLELPKLREVIEGDEVYVERGINQQEMEYVKTAIGNRIIYPVTITPETLKGLKVLSNLTLILVVIQETQVENQKITFYEPKYYLITLSFA
ncbi:hypothetical protein N617_gp02 [Stygiolobus rod-shaped virus]|uniref:Uncharacterized protein n=1 Tax=Stygiolobus rod-shaped virus TaxID=537009 RepID=B6EFA8_9VIRU|nr:hypothetical protein N617_gp02 [Stygiolobus rod-shaped virus]CAQ58443.1 hypothetical protein [Stygiolobus rod-shaped virus]